MIEAGTALAEIIEGLPEGDPQRNFLLSHLREIQVHTLLPFLNFEKFPATEAEIKEELARQAKEYIELELHRHPDIKVGKGKFKDSLVALASPRPEKFADKSPLPLAVFGQISPKDIYIAAGFRYCLAHYDVNDWRDDPNGWRTPQGLYLTWMVDTGAGNLGRKVMDVRASLPADTRGATLADGSSLVVAHSGILKHHYPYLPGTSVSVEFDLAPAFERFLDGQLGVTYCHVDEAYPRCGSALCGRD